MNYIAIAYLQITIIRVLRTALNSSRQLRENHHNFTDKLFVFMFAGRHHIVWPFVSYFTSGLYDTATVRLSVLHCGFEKDKKFSLKISHPLLTFNPNYIASLYTKAE